MADAQSRAEQMFQAQARVRSFYHRGRIDDAIAEFDATIRPALGAVDPRVSGLARRLAQSIVQMVDDDPAVIEFIASGQR